MTTPSETLIDPLGLLSHYVTVEMVHAADVIGMWNDIAKTDAAGLDVDSFADAHNLSKDYVKAIADYLFRVGFLEFTDSSRKAIHLSKMGHAFLAEECLGHFRLVVGAYGHVVHRTAELAAQRITYGADIRRDPEVLAIASAQIGRSKLHSSYEVVLECAGSSHVASIVDIGCGAADFLALLADRTRAAMVLGIDLSPEPALSHGKSWPQSLPLTK